MSRAAWVALAGLIGLNAIVVGLVAALPQWHRPDADEPVVSRDSEVTPAAAELVGPVVLALTRTGTVVRAERGSCASKRAVKVWVAPPGAAPSSVPVEGLVTTYAAFVDGGTVTLVGGDASCKTVAVRGDVDAGGAETDFGPVEVPEQAWWVGPDDSLHPKLSNDSPLNNCSYGGDIVVATSGSDQVVYGGCDATGITQLDPVGTESWPMPGLTALAMWGPGRGFALTRSPGCVTRLWRLLPDGSDWLAGACLGADGAPLGLAVSADEVAVQVGEKLLSSSDDGATWKKR